MPKGYDHKYTYTNLGYNLKMSDMQAAVGLAQIKKAEDFHKKRKFNFKLLYNKLTKFNKVFIMPEISKKFSTIMVWFSVNVKEISKI